MSSAGAPNDPTWSVRRRYFPAVEGMRGFAAICVLVGHVLLFSYSAGGLYELGRWLAPFGLVIFFTISGFLLYRPFLAARQVGESVGELTPSYLWRRAVRILPAYWVALTISSLWLNWTEVLSDHWWVYYGMLQAYSPHWVLNGIAPAWSLCVEVTFYLALPLVALALAGVGLGSGRRSGRCAGSWRSWAASRCSRSPGASSSERTPRPTISSIPCSAAWPGSAQGCCWRPWR